MARKIKAGDSIVSNADYSNARDKSHCAVCGKPNAAKWYPPHWHVQLDTNLWLASRHTTTKDPQKAKVYHDYNEAVDDLRYAERRGWELNPRSLFPPEALTTGTTK